MKFAITGLVAASLMLNGCTKGPALPTENADAAEMCYAAQAKALEGTTGKLPTKTALGPLAYFSVLAVKSRAGGKPGMADFQKFAKGDDVKAKYAKTEHLTDALPECLKRFPLADTETKVTLPTDEGERNAICFYTAAYATGKVENDNVDTDAVTQKAASYYKITQDPTNPMLMSIATKYNVRNADDGVRLAADTIGRSTDLGNLYSILSACPSP
jgi:hypothetical protein